MRQLAWPDFRQLYKRRRSKCSDGKLPGRDQISPSGFPNLLARVYLIDVRKPSAPQFGFRSRLAGIEHFLIDQRAITGLDIEEAFAPGHLQAMRDAYTAVVASKRPQVARSHAAVKGRHHIKYDRLLLPLAWDGTTVDMLLGYLHRLDEDS